MLRDVFYYGKKPNAHPREKFAKNLLDARKQCATSHFWIINEYSDYRNFDWDFDYEFLPDEDVWAENHNNVWPSIHQKDSGTWLCPKEHSDVIVYRADVDPVKRKNEITHHWKILENIDISKFDFSWHPDPTDPPYIYRWGCKYFPVELKTCLEYHVDGATEIKYMKEIVELLPNWDCIVENQKIDYDKFDMSWRPDPRDPPFIYVWGNKWIDGKLKSTLEYHVSGATEKKYMPELIPVVPEWERWVEHVTVDKTKFDFTWRPDPREPAYNYVWGNAFEQAELKPTLEYRMPNATQTKYMSDVAPVTPQWDRWTILEDIDKSTFDFTWRPDPREPALVYVFGNELYNGTIMPTIEYKVEGASGKKYIENWTKPKLKSKPELFTHLENSQGIDYQWRPNPTSPPYIYVWGNQWNKPEDKISIQFVVEGATEYQYMQERATRNPCMDNWDIPKNIDVSDFDFSWEPSPADPPFIYQFGTQWQKTGGPRYIVSGATEVKYISTLIAKALPTKDNWAVPKNVDVSGFDFSWHPDDTSPPYIYNFATQWALTGGPIYTVPGATEIKYVETPNAIALPDKTNWIVPDDVDSETFDFSWHPYVEDQPYVYQFGTQWQKTGGPKYVTPGVIPSSPTKYIDTRILKSKKIANKKNFAVLNNYKIKEFDFSWHPDDTEEPYIYVFGNNLYPAEIMPTIEYVVPGAKQIKYINEIVATLDVDLTNWEIPENLDTTGFDFSWKPNPKDPPMIYQFGTQWQKTGGPRYIVPDATEVKYIDTQRVKRLPIRKNFAILNNSIVEDFDYSWHPDDTEEPYIYQFGNNQYPAEIMPTVEYAVPGAKQIKYIDTLIAKLGKDLTNWEIPNNIDVNTCDFTWRPNPKDPPYIYQFGTQWQKTGGPRYVIDGATEVKYIESKVKALPTDKNWITVNNLIIENFDYSWHPDDTEEPYIYVFGNTQYPAEIMPTIEYRIPGATQIKYVNDIVAKLAQDKNNWIIPDDIDVSNFDFSWKPDPNDPPYIYQFGTQWQRSGGPRYVIEGATEIKYVSTHTALALPTKINWVIPDNVDISEFDFSWHPDDADKAFIYQFGTQWALTGGPKYVMPGATEIKYIDEPIAKAAPNKKNWVIPNNIDESSFDFSWHPYVEDQPYIYQFGTQWQKTGGPKYYAPGADETSFTKYIDTRILKAKATASSKNWVIPDNIDVSDFDFSWHPDDTEGAYIYQFGTTWSRVGGPKYVVDGATQIKFVDDIKAKIKAKPDKSKWQIPNDIDQSSFDFSWQPDIDDQPYIYQFGTQWQKTGGPRYTVEGATEVKYIDVLKAKRLPTKTNNWKINIPVENFDFSWHPDDTEEPYIYVFGNQWNHAELESTVEYHVEGATQIKYINDIVAKVAADKTNWDIIEDVDAFDFTWRPNPTDPPYIYVFGNKQYAGTIMPTITYTKSGATQKKYVDSITAKLASKPELFENTTLITEFDYSWRPNPNDPPYIYQFGTQWAKTHGPRFKVAGATEIKYISDRIAKILPDMTNWEIPDGFDLNSFDFSWHPDGTVPAYIYQFGTVLDDINLEDGPKYVSPGHNNHVVHTNINIAKLHNIEYPKYVIETTLEDLIKQHSDEIFWALRKNIDYSSFDFNWRPTKENVFHINIFGSPEAESTQTYFVNAKMYNSGYTEKNYLEQDTRVDDLNLAKLFKKLDIFVVDRGNPEAQTRFEQLKVRFGNVQKTRYLNTWVDTINRCINRSTTELCWILNSELDYTDFDFEFYPNPWQMKMVHVFGTQWSHWGTTFVVNKETFTNDTKYVKIIEHLNNLNFVKDKKAVATNNLYDMFVMDHGNPEISDVMHILQSKSSGKMVSTIKAESTYLQTFKKIIASLPEKKDHYIWICSSVCDYRKFDFSYVCDPFAKDNLHVFPSEKQKFGDTFLVDVNQLRNLINDMQILEDYGKVNYNQHQRVSRLPAPVFTTYEDTHFKNALQEFNFPYAVFITQDWNNPNIVDEEPMRLWTPEHKTIAVTSVGGTRIVVPDEVKKYVNRELYDYPYIKTNSRLLQSNPLDIVFLSNGESCADENYEHLLKVTHGLSNRIIRIDGVNGRVQAYHAAANASETPWMFTVFAKLKVNNKFDWNWQPDRLQVPKHYIFHAKNPVNGLIYGHQAMIAYNKKLVLENQGKGLDFTQDDEHEVIELLSGVATYNTDAWSTWRTAFREVIKLQKNKTKIGKERLNIWLNNANGDYAEHSINGAKDAVEYYKKVKGNINKLKLSYEWQWLRDYYEAKYK